MTIAKNMNNLAKIIKKRSKSLWIGLYLSVVCLNFCSCSTNDGNIGPLFGQWVMVSMDVDGEPYDGWQSDDYPYTTFRFQNDICFVSKSNERLDVQTSYCTWAWQTERKVISLNFTYQDNDFPEPGTGIYAPPAWLMMYTPGVYYFDVQWVNDKEMIWTGVTPQDRILTFHLKKNF